MNDRDNTSRFTIRDEAGIQDSMYAADAENLRIEKLGTRITLVAVLIPCLLVIILVVAYLDIKNRVISTQNTGSIGVEKLSQDLESRFSSLSLKQAKIEQQLAEQAKTVETTTAALQVNLKKATTEFKRIAEGKTDKSALNALSKKMDADMAALEKDISNLTTAFSKFDDELATQILLMAEGLKKDQRRLAQIEKKAQRIDSEKLSRESMNLALGLERLALQEMIKDRIKTLQKELATLNKKVIGLNKRLDAQARKTVPPPPATAAPTFSAPASPTPAPPSGNKKILEQTIN